MTDSLRSSALAEVTSGQFDPELEEQVRFVRPLWLPGVEIMHARSCRLWKVWHETYTLCLIHGFSDTCVDGVSRWRYRGSQHASSAGQVMLMQPGEAHVTEHIEHRVGHFDVFMIDVQRVDEMAGELGLRTPVHLSVAASRDPDVCGALARLTRAVRQLDPLACQQRLVDALVTVLRCCGERTAGAPPAMSSFQVRRACEYIRACYASGFSLDDLAAACGASKSSICHTLPRQLGVTPGELRSLVRVHHAKEMLARGCPPSEVAALIGFADQPQLTRHFKRYWGVTPARYARMTRQAVSAIRPAAVAAG
jgi:AraC-like DNA-binding protein